MCGIAGWLGSVTDGQQSATRMARALRHRGPDSQGIRSWPEATLVHTRLSIIDLSPTGAQPIANQDETVWAVFNGEIYNHRELRRELESRGHVFRGRSDSEVLPHLYQEEGPGFVSRLRGMFSLAIFDTRAKTLLLARDRFGIKPLFYAQAPHRLAFASEINALLTLPGVDDRPDRQALYDFAALLYIPAPETFYRGIRALQAGEVLEARLNHDGISWKTRTFHQWAIAPDPAITATQAVDRTDALLTTAVQRQMESDVPLGALLSGGIDSSLVSAAAQEAATRSLHTFNVRFSEQEYDETWAAVAVAQHIGSDHTTLDMDDVRGTWEHVTGLLQHAGQPFADTSLFAAHAVCRLMRQHVTVALSGDGGDEAFGGYNTFWQIARIARLQLLPAPLLHAASLLLTPAAGLGLVPHRLLHRLREFENADDISVMQNLFSWTREDEHRRLCLDEGKQLPIRRFFEPKLDIRLPRGASRLERLSAATTETNLRLVLPNDFLFKVDTASMKESLEIRVPMLDEDLFAFGLTLPHRLKVSGRTGKLVLRGVADRRLPPAVARKPKWGFSIPIDTWVDASFKTRVRETLLGRTSRLPEVFRAETYRPIIEAFCSGQLHPDMSRQGLYQRVVMLLSVHLALSSKSHPTALD
ncbi:MAG: asparagine synthase (glutamine-hydrolyzing) [Nitrospira sp.]|nr:asparagine synthase (glutamine-hydrolyzing) [Nitrospira sp.]